MLLMVAVGSAIVVGFAGAPRFDWSFSGDFDWSLAAVTGTAIGTILLAAYTANLARATRQEVAVTVADQKLRDRPIVVISVIGVTFEMVEPDVSKTVDTLDVVLRNVGLAPALDIHLWVCQGDEKSGAEVVPVLHPGEVGESERKLSLSGLTKPDGDFDREALSVEGTFTDRFLQTRDDVQVLNDAGLRDEREAGLKRTRLRAHLYVNVQQPPEKKFVRDGSEQIVEREESYHCQIANTGWGDAWDVTLEVCETSTGDIVQTLALSDAPGVQKGLQEEFTLTLPLPHQTLGLRLTWHDALDSGEWINEAVFQAGDF